MQELTKNEKKGKHWECYEKMLVAWLERNEEKLQKEYLQRLQKNPPENFTDEDYVRATTIAKDTGVFPAYVGRCARDILKRKLCLDRNSELMKKMFAINTERLVLYEEENQEVEYMEGLIILAEALYLTGTVREEDTLYSWEKDMLKCKNPAGIIQCIRSGFLVKERVDDYLDYIMVEGARELLPVFVDLKFQG